MSSSVFPVLISGTWRQAEMIQYFSAINPMTKVQIDEFYPVSSKQDIFETIKSAAIASRELLNISPSKRADFLEKFADRIENRKEEIVKMANQETGYAIEPRLLNVELPRMTDQLRKVACAVREHSWTMPVIDTGVNIRSLNQSLEGGIAIFSPNNFPLVFNSVGGSDFAGAIGAGNSVICKGNPSHPGTTRLLAEEAHEAIKETGMPLNTFQLIYHMEESIGLILAGSPDIGAIAYTGSRKCGMTLKASAEKTGNPIYLEMSSANPVLILPDAIKKRDSQIAEELVKSCTLGTGQFCTKPGLVLVFKDQIADEFIDKVKKLMEETPDGVLLSESVMIKLDENVGHLREAGARPLTGASRNEASPGYSYKNTLLTIEGSQFIEKSSDFQIEAFGPQTMIVIMENVEQAEKIIELLEGNLTGTIYSETSEEDKLLYERLVPLLTRKVGRITNDKMPTDVAVVTSMNHGGPYPATGHPAFSSVGIPFSMQRFSMRKCFDGVSDERLPVAIQNANPDKIWRMIDASWTTDSIE